MREKRLLKRVKVHFVSGGYQIHGPLVRALIGGDRFSIGFGSANNFIEFEHNGQVIPLLISDNTAEARFREIHSSDSRARDVDIYMCVFNANDKSSYEIAKQFLSKIDKVHKGSPVKLLVRSAFDISESDFTIFDAEFIDIANSLNIPHFTVRANAEVIDMVRVSLTRHFENQRLIEEAREIEIAQEPPSEERPLCRMM
jgi:hypothetical protein